MAQWQAGHSSAHRLGLFASSKINTGDLILSEAPLLELKCAEEGPALTAAYDKMFLDARNLNEQEARALRIMVQRHNTAWKDVSVDEFMAGLRNPSFELGRAIVDTFDTSYPFDTSTKTTALRLFRNLSLLNHGCWPNAEASWSAEEECINVYALRNIEKNQEIFISYIDRDQPMTDRKQVLGFFCQCLVCKKNDLAFRTRFEATVAEFRKNLSAIDDFRRQYFPNSTGARPTEITQQVAVAVMGDPEAKRLVRTIAHMMKGCENKDFHHSSLAAAYDFMHVMFACSAVLDPNDLRFRSLILHTKLKQFAMLDICLGPTHPRAELVMQQLLRMCRDNPEKMPVCMDLFRQRGFKFVWVNTKARGRVLGVKWC